MAPKPTPRSTVSDRFQSSVLTDVQPEGVVNLLAVIKHTTLMHLRNHCLSTDTCSLKVQDPLYRHLSKASLDEIK